LSIHIVDIADIDKLDCVSITNWDGWDDDSDTSGRRFDIISNGVGIVEDCVRKFD